MLTVNALFAGFSGALTINLAVRQWVDGSPEMFAILLSIAALWCFAFAAERITDALDEGKIDVYLSSMRAYNIGVVLVLFSIGIVLWAQDHPRLAIIVMALSIYPWIKDTYWLFFASAEEMDAYRKELAKNE